MVHRTGGKEYIGQNKKSLTNHMFLNSVTIQMRMDLTCTKLSFKDDQDFSVLAIGNHKSIK